MEFAVDILSRRAALTPGLTAMAELETGDAVTYAQLHRRGGGAARLLADAGVTAGGRVAVLCRNRIAFFELLFACARIGAIMVPLNWRMPPSELQGLTDDCQPALLAFGAEDAAAAGALNLPGAARLDLDGDYAARRDGAEPLPGRAHWPTAECWYLLYTSGTTGRPKAVIQTYAMAMVNFININDAVGMRRGETTLNYLPLFHTGGVNLHTLPALIAGGRVLITPGFDAGRTIALLAEGALDTFFGVPAIYRELSLHPGFAAADLTRVRHFGCGGAPLPDALVEVYAKKGVRVCNGFGMTETGPTAFLADPEQALEKIGSVGKPRVLVEARIARPDGSEAAPGETGEIQFHGPGLTPGYWNRPEETKNLFTPDGWLKSGDLGRADEDGYVHVAGRIKEMYISGGENVYPAEVENVLARHPAVQEAAVTGMADDKWGEVGRAHVILRAGATADAAALAAHCRAHLAAYKVPKSFVFCDDFPRTAAGKVQKHLLPESGA